MPARVAVVTPFAFPSVRGNAITVERVVRGLRRRGVELRVWDLSVTPEPAVASGLVDFRPALIHAFHAYRAGPLGVRLAQRAGIPVVVTITGTDVNQDLGDPERGPVTRRVLEEASAVTVFDESMADGIGRALGTAAPPVAVVPQSVDFGEEAPAAGDGPVLPPPAGPVLLFPAGIRPVKNPRFPLAPLDAVAARHPGLELRYAGPVLDPDEGEALLRALAGRPWARYLGAVPHHRMRGLLEGATIVLNCSVSEGGMANSVLEALALGRAVLASRIDGHRALVEDGVTGLLFSTPEDFAAKAERLLGDPDLRRRLGAAGRQRVTALFSPAREIEGYLGVYRRLVPPRAVPSG